MWESMRRLSLLAILGVTLALCTGVAAAAGGGSLTAFEYQQLVSTRDKLKSDNLRTAKGLNAAIWACEQIQMATQLLTEERADCVSQLQMSKFGAVMKSYEADCVAYKSVAARLTCLLPPYEQFYGQVAQYYRAESTIHRIATARDLGEKCADLLSDTPYVISEEKRARDAIALIIAAAKAGQLLNFEAASGLAVTALADVAKGQTSNNDTPSLCPHQ
jgi:hypothetical protein